MVALVSFLEADKNAIRSIHGGEPLEGVLGGLPTHSSFTAGFGPPGTRGLGYTV